MGGNLRLTRSKLNHCSAVSRDTQPHSVGATYYIEREREMGREREKERERERERERGVRSACARCEDEREKNISRFSSW